MIHGRTHGSALTEVSPGMLLSVPVIVTSILWLTTPNPVELPAVGYAFVLLLLPWGSYVAWRIGNRAELPLFAMVASAYWVYFALALFWGARSFHTAIAAAAIVPTESSITDTVWMALVGVTAMWAGMRIPITLVAPSRLPDISDRQMNWMYVRVVMLGTLALSLRSGSMMAFGAEGRQLMATLTSVVPTAAFVLLFNRYLDGKSTQADRMVLAIGGAGLVGASLAAGWLGPALSWGITCGSLLLLKKHRIPVLPVVLTAGLLVFLQVGKNDFRNNYWGGSNGDSSLVERVSFWVERSWTAWGDAFSSRGDANPVELASKSLERASLLTQVAHVLEMTPGQVPYQEGATYKYLAITWVPRFLWPDKPSVNEANRFYQVAYGLTSERGLNNVSIAVGALAEGFINFAWFGAIGVMLFIGIALGIFQRTFVMAQSSSIFLAVGLALIPVFLSIESQLAVYFGGVLQQAILGIAVFLPIVERRSAASFARPRPALQHP